MAQTQLKGLYHGGAHAELQAPAGFHVLRMPEPAPGIRRPLFVTAAGMPAGGAAIERIRS